VLAASELETDALTFADATCPIGKALVAGGDEINANPRAPRGGASNFDRLARPNESPSCGVLIKSDRKGGLAPSQRQSG
jgi:hypothetical protein